LLLVFAVLVISVRVVIDQNTSVLTDAVIRERTDSDVQIVTQHFADAKRDVQDAARILVSAPGLAEAVQTGRVGDIAATIQQQAEALGLSDLDVFDSRANRLMNRVAEGVQHAEEAEVRLVQVGLSGAEANGLFLEEPAEGGGVGFILLSVVPIRDAQNAIVGAMLAGRKLDAAFLDRLDFARADSHLAVIDPATYAVTATDLSGSKEFDEIGIGQARARIDLAASGQTVADYNTTPEEGDSTPDTTAFIPLGADIGTQAVLAVRAEFETIYEFRDQLRLGAGLAVGPLALVTLSMLFLTMRANVIRPMRRMQKVAEQIAAGDLSQRVAANSRDEMGQLAASFNTMTDKVNGLIGDLQGRIAEVQQARERAERADNVKSAFLASMSHELRTPLNAVINFTRFVIDGDTGPVTPEQVELLNEVVTSAKHLLTLINDVLDMSKIESGSLNLFVEDDIDLNAALKSAIATAHGLLRDKPVTLVADIPPDLPRLRGDRQRITQILLNILSNAARFTDQGQITVSVTPAPDGEVIIAVRDTGPGIAPEEQPLVFQAFKQTQLGTRKAGGTGLGMPISKSLAEAHGGRLWLDSTPGKGSTFYVALPIKAEQLLPTLAEPQRA
jgi:signal transduction histidine kinase